MTTRPRRLELHIVGTPRQSTNCEPFHPQVSTEAYKWYSV